jgi:hypothetical protein
MSFACIDCGKGPWDGVTVIRINEKGVPAICKCEACLGKEMEPIQGPIHVAGEEFKVWGSVEDQ